VPGHSPDHVANHDPKRGLLFAGDAYLPARDTLRADEDLAGALDGLHTLRAVDADRLLPGHGSTVDDPQAAISAVLDHFDELRARTRELLDDGHDGADLRRRMLGFEPFMRYYTGGHFAKQNFGDEIVRLATARSPRASRFVSWTEHKLDK